MEENQGSKQSHDLPMAYLASQVQGDSSGPVITHQSSPACGTSTLPEVGATRYGQNTRALNCRENDSNSEFTLLWPTKAATTW